MAANRVIYVDGNNPTRSEYPLDAGYYVQTRTSGGTWAIVDRTRYETEEDAQAAAESDVEHDFDEGGEG